MKSQTNGCANVFSMVMNCCGIFSFSLSWQAGHCFSHQFCNLLLCAHTSKKGPNLSVSLLPHNAALFQIVAVLCFGFGWVFFFPCSKNYTFFSPLRTWLLRNLLKHLLIILQNHSCLVSRRILKSEVGITGHENRRGFDCPC